MKTKVPYARAKAIADGLVESLAPSCERIEIAGSIRRQAAEVGDIEIVAIPAPIRDLLGEPIPGDTFVDLWINDQGITPRKNGRRMKQFDWEGIQIDLFLASAENFGYILMLRTGPEDFSHSMVTVQRWGLRPANVRTAGGAVYVDGRETPTPEEADIWRIWGMEPVAPEDRA